MVKNTYQLIQAIRKMYPVIMFFKDRYFPDGRTFYSDKVLIETKKQGRTIAPFVIPMIDGIKMENQGYRAMEYDAPYIAIYNLITNQDLAKKAFGEDPDSNRSPEDRQNEVQGEKMDELRNSILRRLEEMCTQLICNGEIVMNHYASADDAASGVNPQVQLLRFFEKTFQNRYTFSKDFAAMSASEKILEFYKMASILHDRGIAATDLVMTSDVSMLLMSDPKFLDFYDKSRVEIGSVKPEQLPEGVVCNGSININGVVMTMYTYSELYEDMDGSEKRFLPKGTLAFLKPNLGTTAYGQVTFLKGEKFESHAERIVPRVLPDEKNNVIKVEEFSRPVPYVYDWDSWLVANIYEKAVSTNPDSQKSGLDPDEFTGEDEGESGSTGDGTKVTLLTEEEINAFRTKAEVIAYGESIGLEGLKDSSSLPVLKEAVLNYQQENYGSE